MAMKNPSHCSIWKTVSSFFVLVFFSCVFLLNHIYFGSIFLWLIFPIYSSKCCLCVWYHKIVWRFSVLIGLLCNVENIQQRNTDTNLGVQQSVWIPNWKLRAWFYGMLRKSFAKRHAFNFHPVLPKDLDSVKPHCPIQRIFASQNF